MDDLTGAKVVSAADKSKHHSLTAAGGEQEDRNSRYGSSLPWTQESAQAAYIIRVLLLKNVHSPSSEKNENREGYE
jgi:hypothetical protein